MNTFTKVILVFLCCMALGFLVPAQTTSLSFTPIATDINRPRAGANEWSYDQNVVNIPTQGTNTQRLDRYWRFTWLDFQPAGGSAGVYNFTTFDGKIQESIQKGQGFSFGVMQQCTSCDPNLQNPIGGTNILPTWLITAMPNSYVFGGDRYPDYNSSAYQTALKNLSIAINAHILAGSFNGVRYRDVIDFIDIRGYGNFGEWTNNDFSHITPTVASLDSIISYQLQSFPTFQCVNMIGAFDGGQLPNVNVPPAVGYYALTTSNAHGKMGWRRDNWGQVDNYIRQFLDLNPTVFSGLHFDTATMARYKYAPIVGEPQDGGPGLSGGFGAGNFEDFVTQVQRYHAESFGNGNFNNAVNATIQNNFRAASAASGYRILIDGGTMTTTPAAGQPYNVTLQLKNTNGVPPYSSWKIVYEWWNGTTLLQRDTSAFDLNGFLSTTDIAFSSNLNLNTVPAGTNYSLHVKVVDPLLNYRIPMPLFITGRLADGSYVVRSGITVTSNSGGAVANAGPNQTTSGSSVTLTSAASQGATSQAWTQISGPNTATLVTPTAVTTTASGLITGTYVFQVAINGLTSGQGISQMSVQVSLSSPIANAGNPQTITLPTNSVTLNGSGSTGATTYSWTNVSGPSTPAIATPTAVSTNVPGLIEGNYIFQLSINSGASTSQTNVTVLPAAAPVANAGPSQTITLPVNSVTVSGSGSSGTISSYLWTRISGPNNPVFGSSSSVSTTLSSLIQGVYVIQLSLNGGTSTDTLQIVVNQALPPPSQSIVTIFTTQTPNSNAWSSHIGTAITVGSKFTSSINGFITGLRFYKVVGMNGPHIGILYKVNSPTSGTVLAQANYINESTSGWQVIQFQTPIPITAGLVYMTALFAADETFVGSHNYFNTAVVNSPLSFIASGGPFGNNGVQEYNSVPTYPTQFAGSPVNFWLDVFFSYPSAIGTLPGHLHHSIYFKAAP